MKRLIKLDLDGCFVDFMRGSLKWHNKELPYKSIVWNYCDTLLPGGAKEFWAPLGYEFWANLEWTPQGRELYSRILKLVGPEHLLIATSPCDTRGCADGKIKWIQDNMPELKRRYSITPVKYETPVVAGSILLDDHEPNIYKYTQNGGKGILYPQPWNTLSHKVDDEGNIDLDEFLDSLSKEWKFL